MRGMPQAQKLGEALFSSNVMSSAAARRARGAQRSSYPPPGRQGQPIGGFQQQSAGPAYPPVPTVGGGQRRSAASIGTLKVLVQSASGLKKGDLISSDPYAIVSIANQDKRTRVQRKTLKPGVPPFPTWL